MTRLDKAGVRWELEESFASRLERVLASPAQVIRESPAKLVTVHECDSARYYVKRYRHAAVPLRPLKFFFKHSQARKEWDLARQITQRDVPIVRHLALGERWSCGLQESILITEGFDGREPTPADADRVLAFVRQLHERGVLQRDLHPGNLLVNAREIRLVDLHGSEILNAISESEREANLAFLCMFLRLPVSERIASLSWQMRKTHFHDYSRRCLRHNRHFRRESHGGLNWQVRMPLTNERVRAILAEPDAFLATRAEILKPGRSSTVGRADGLVLKRYNLRKPESLLKDLARSSRARRAYRKAYHLELVGISTARPIAFAERRCCRVLLRSYLLMEEIPGATHRGDWLLAAELIARLHEEGFTHRDLKDTNILFDTAGKPFLIDLEGMRFIGSVPQERAAADVARLARALPDWNAVSKAFVERYCRVRGIQSDFASQITPYLGGRR